MSIQSAAPRKKRIVEDAGRQKALDSVDLALTPPPTSELSDAVSYGKHIGILSQSLCIIQAFE